MAEKVMVLMCRVGKEPEVVEIENSNEGVADALNARCVNDLSVVNPWSPDVAVVYDACTRGKANRYLTYEHGRGECLIMGDFIIGFMPRGCGEFLSIPRMVIDRYSRYMEVV